ncbi:hypothetical protein ACHZ97_18335 [Lysobacter soli]|uniref:hypothetical protein n=1 Tax=Lysobacter soli TaxID=453783 RepID=UPI0037C977F7
MNAPRAPMPIATSRFGYPFKDKDDREIVDPYAFIEALIPVQGGHYLLGSYGFFHGGIHLDRACSSKLSIDEGIRCLADGEVVAYRIDSDYHDATPGAVGDGATLRPYSTGFVLVRHRLQAPSPPMPAAPPPMETPGADIRDWGTRLYADPQGRQPLAWLRHGTPLIVQVGAYTPGQSTLVRVTDTLDSKLPREGWISRSHLALDPAVGTGMRSAFGLKDTVATTVYRGDSIDPDKLAAHAENKAQRQRPELETAPVLTLYSLYMHVASERDYERNVKWKRPSWWPERGGTRKPEATDRVVALAKPLPIRQGDLIGYLGEDVPAHAYPVAGQPVTKRLLHLEVFSGDDVPAYLVKSRRWAKEYLPDSERTLLLLMPGDTLQRDVGGPAMATVALRQLLRVGGLESRTVEGKRWRKVTLGMTQGHATGWIEEEERLVSPWEWPGFEVQDEVASPDGFRHDDPEAFADYLRGDGPRPPDTPFYKALRSLVDRNHDGNLSEEELDRLLRNRHHADHLTRLIVRHETAWTRTSMRRHTETARRIAAKLGPVAVENVNAEEPRGEKLPWWEDVAAGVEGFPASSRVWHFHAGGVAGNLSSAGNCKCGCCLGAIFSTVSYHGVCGPSYSGKRSLSSYDRWGVLLQAGTITQDEVDILVAMSANEGNLDSLQAYDSEALTAGAMQKTVNRDGYGEFPLQVAAFRSDHPHLYDELFVQCGWEIKSTTSGPRMYYNGETGAALKDALRRDFSTKSKERKASPALASIVNAIASDAFMDRQVLDFVRRLHVVESLVPRGHQYSVGDFLRSKLGRAVALDHHVNRPGYVARDLGAAISAFLAANPNGQRS